jgi:C4-dicarboxylate-specific signal transduction histidine kinase
LHRLLFTLRRQLLAITLLVFGVASVAMLWSTREVVQQVGQTEALNDGQRSGSLLSTALSANVAARNLADLEETLNALVANDAFDYLQVVDVDGGVLASAGHVERVSPLHPNADVNQFNATLALEGRTYGHVYFGLAKKAEHTLVDLIFWRVLLVCVGCLAFAAIAQAYFTGLATQRLTALRQGTERMAAGEQLVEIADHGQDEMAALAKAFNRMSQTLANRERQLQDVNQQLELRVVERTQHLEDALETLRLTQDDLVEAQRLSSLGSLVAGVSHELNTPIGNAVTAASALSETLRTLGQIVESHSVSRKALLQNIADGREMAELVVRSTERAASLIVSFKRVAVDDTSRQRRHFDLKSSLEDLLRAFAPNLKRYRWTVQLDVPTSITLDSYPGPLDQVVGNLLQNAERHAFAPDQEGCFSIAARQDGERVTITLKDDGQGMTADVLARIFEPFFTTKLGFGGSGLGLSIVRNIVHSTLGGTLTVQSAPGVGTAFVLTIPVVAPTIKAKQESTAP